MLAMLMLASRVKTKLKCLHSLKKSVGFKKAENFNTINYNKNGVETSNTINYKKKYSYIICTNISTMSIL